MKAAHCLTAESLKVKPEESVLIYLGAESLETVYFKNFETSRKFEMFDYILSVNCWYNCFNFLLFFVLLF